LKTELKEKELKLKIKEENKKMKEIINQ